MIPQHEANEETLGTLQQPSSEHSLAESSRPVSGVSSKSAKVTRHEQERTRAEYLQAQGFAAVDDRNSAESAISSGETSVSERIRATQRRLDALPPVRDEAVNSAA